MFILSEQRQSMIYSFFVCDGLFIEMAHSMQQAKIEKEFDNMKKKKIAGKINLMMKCDFIISYFQ